jgi:two-component system, sensor histidine kinase and response regulator
MPGGITPPPGEPDLPSPERRSMTDMLAPPTSGPLILVADDVQANVELLFDQLHVLGYRATAAYDGPSALQACFDDQPDLCILDVSMPAGDLGVDDRSTGFEVCRRIKRDPRTARIPVIFVTALNDTTDRVKAIEAGGDDFLTKPHNRLVLGARVRSLLKLKAATDALEESYRKLRELEKVRDDLMKMVVHDLKTPLTSVIATMEMTLDEDFGPLTADQRKMLGDAEGKAEDLLALIDDLLEVSRIEETTLRLEAEPIAPAAFLTEILHEFEVRFQAEGTKASLDVADDAPVFHADKSLLRRVFANLIQNAITHSSRAVTLRLGARANGDGILFTVQDDGPGIPPEYQEVIFRKFERVKTPNAPRVRSSGLGLAFCRLAVDAHGGRIWVRSAEGEGSSFHVALPLTPRPREQNGAPVPPATPGGPGTFESPLAT